MVNNSTNINQTKNHLSLSLTEHRTKDHDIWRHGLEHVQQCEAGIVFVDHCLSFFFLPFYFLSRITASDYAILVSSNFSLNQLMGSQLSPLDKWVSNGNTYINKRYKKKVQIHFHSKRRQNEWQPTHVQYNIRVNEYS